MAPRAHKSKERNHAAGELRCILADHIPEAVAFLVGIMRDAEQKPELRMKAAESILDRACGKATSSLPAETADAPPTTVLFEGVLEEWSR